MNILYIKTVCVLKPTSISYLHTHVSDIHVHRLPYQPRTKGDKVFLAFWLPGPSMAFEGLSCGFWWRSNSAKWRWSKIVLHKWPWGVSIPVLNRLCLGGILWWSLGSTTISDNLDVSVNMITVCVYGQLENSTAICIFKYSWLQMYIFDDICTWIIAPFDAILYGGSLLQWVCNDSTFNSNQSRLQFSFMLFLLTWMRFSYPPSLYRDEWSPFCRWSKYIATIPSFSKQAATTLSIVDGDLPRRGLRVHAYP